MIMQRENKKGSLQIWLKRVQKSVSITEQQPGKSSNKDVFPFLASFNISGSALRIIMNNSTFREEREKSKGAGNISNISVLVGHKQGFVILYRHFLYFIDSFGVFKSEFFLSPRGR